MKPDINRTSLLRRQDSSSFACKRFDFGQRTVTGSMSSPNIFPIFKHFTSKSLAIYEELFNFAHDMNTVQY